MTNEEKFRKALIKGRNFRGNMIKISEVMEVCDFVDEEDLLAFIEDDGFKIVNFRFMISNMAIDNAAFDLTDFAKTKVKMAFRHYKKKRIARSSPFWQMAISTLWKASTTAPKSHSS